MVWPLSLARPTSYKILTGRSRIESAGQIRSTRKRALGAKLCRQQVVLPSDPTRDQECIDQDPNDRDDQPDDGEAQDELSYRHSGASQIEIVAAEAPQEEPQDIRDQRG